MTNCTGEIGICSRCISGYWGGLCSDICPRHCLGNRCDQINGHCIDGCISGRHGLTCNKTCSSRCLGSLCDPKTGNCSTGCIDNWKGTRCDGKRVTNNLLQYEYTPDIFNTKEDKFTFLLK